MPTNVCDTGQLWDRSDVTPGSWSLLLFTLTQKGDQLLTVTVL